MNLAGTIAATVANLAASTAINFAKETVLQKGVDAFLSNSNTVLGRTIHWTTILTSTLLQAGRSKGRGLYSLIAGPSAVSNKVFNDIMESLLTPNIEGIPIFTDKINTERTAEVTTKAVFTQSKGTKESRTDNSFPQLKKWQITGYLQSLLPIIDSFAVIKTTLVLQVQTLDMFMLSRRPVWFKTNLNEFVLCMITSFATEQDATTGNVIKVNIVLQEYKPIEVNKAPGFIKAVMLEV